jgi:hypothetical protein
MAGRPVACDEGGIQRSVASPGPWRRGDRTASAGPDQNIGTRDSPSAGIGADISDATRQVAVGVHGGGMVAVFPVGAARLFALVVFLRRAPGDQLHAARDFTLSAVYYQQVDVIRRHDVVQHTEVKAFPRLEQPVPPPLPVAAKLALVTTVGDMAQSTRKKQAVSNDDGEFAHLVVAIRKGPRMRPRMPVRYCGPDWLMISV